VAEEVSRICRPGKSVVLDPFAGCGTTIIAAQQLGVSAIGLEAHPFVLRVARAKLAWTGDIADFEKAAGNILKRAASSRARAKLPPDSSLTARIYHPAALAELMQLLTAILKEDAEDELCWLALISILRACAKSNTAPWQYVLPRKSKARTAAPLVAFRMQVEKMAGDMRELQSFGIKAGAAEIVRGDARLCEGIEDESIDLVLTSPPYPNNYDYADATRVEMSFLGEVERWADLHQAVRKYLIPSCSQHVDREKPQLAVLLAREELAPIRDELSLVCEQLAELRGTRAGKKNYDAMVAAYFVAMAETLASLSRVMKPGARLCFVVGDSAPYGVHVPVERWLTTLGENVGLGAPEFEETRKRNTKWLNRKHRVPLHEGRLWLTRSRLHRYTRNRVTEREKSQSGR
jgi:tRNA G10  N-methylase Trm11